MSLLSRGRSYPAELTFFESLNLHEVTVAMGLKHHNQVVEVSVLGAELIQPLTKRFESYCPFSCSGRRLGTAFSLIYDAAQNTYEAVGRAFRRMLIRLPFLPLA